MDPREYWRQIFDAVNCGIIVVSRDMVVQRINRNAAAMFNVDEAAAVGLVVDAIPPSARGPLVSIVEETFEKGFAVNEKMTYWRETDIEIELGVTGSLVTSPGGEPEVVVVCRDMTAHRELDRLRRMNQLKSDYVDKVAHELRNPLTTIQTYSQTAASMVDGEPREFLDTVAEECDRMMGLIREMLAACRLESGRLKLTPADVDVVPIVERCISHVALQVARHKITLRVSGGRTFAHADEDKIKEVLLNLIENAVKYSPEGGEITVTVTGGGDTVSVAVADCGIGIEREHLGMLFEKFYRIDSPRTRGIVGTGLGLAIAKGIVNAHGGTIKVASEPGKGSVFTVTLPAAAGASVAAMRS